MLKGKCHLPKLFFKINKIKYGKNLRMVGWPFIFRYSQATLNIGDNVTVNSGFFSNLLGLYQRTIIIARGTGKITIGDHVGISGSTIYARKEITIGNNVLIGVNTKIMDNDFHPIDAQARREGDYSVLELRPVCIEDDVFIGCNCIILKGTHLKKGCVVGAGSVVHGVYPEKSVIAGNPARIIKSLA